MNIRASLNVITETAVSPRRPGASRLHRSQQWRTKDFLKAGGGGKQKFFIHSGQ